MAKYTISPKFALNTEDLKRVGKNALVFLGPALLVLLASTVQVVPSDWKYAAVALYLLNTLTDALRKYLSENKYSK